VLALRSGYILHWFGPRTVGAIAIGSVAVGGVVGALAGSFGVVLLGRAIEGLGLGLVSVVAPTVIALWFPPESRGIPMGIWATSVPLGAAVMFNVAPALAGWGRWRAVWWFGVVICLVALALYRLFARVPASAAAFSDTIYAAHGLVWSSPLYNGTISGAFKNALDWLHVLGDLTPPYLIDKIVGLVSTAGGVHRLQAVNTMDFVVRALRGWAVPLVVPIPRAPHAFDDAGRPRDAQLEAQLRQLDHEVARAARQMATHGVCDYSDPLATVNG